ncbi:MAG: peptidoglycan recognition protein family protein [Treponema sp.]|jgi:N-acetylmuramoyl-L-alanine amidase|nr:peptidoglycan recognition protein family protein [Treponema sp.]
MKIIEKPLKVNQYSRSGRPLGAVKGIILHWTGAPMQRAVNTWGWFETGCPRDKHYSSAHYIIDLDGTIYHAVPDNEVAYHCGSSQPDPKSGKIYTDWAREKFGIYADRPDSNSPNNCTIGIELCVIDNEGNFTQETLEAARKLVAKLLKENRLTVDDVGTHLKVVGWKDCPRLWFNRPELFEEFKKDVETIGGVV